MPPRLSRLAIGLPRISPTSRNSQICLFCSLSRSLRRVSPVRRTRLSQPAQPSQHGLQVRQQSDVSSIPAADSGVRYIPKEPRIELRDALLDLQKHAGPYVNISRLQLALRGLEQSPGEETIRVAVLGIADGGASLKKAKELLRLVVADPLKDEEEWERRLTRDGPSGRPLLLRIDSGADELAQNNRLVEELHVSSPTLNGHGLEILVLEMDPPSMDAAPGEEGLESAALVPTMEIPTSSTGRYTPVTTPVHKALVVADGIVGAASLISQPIDVERDIIGTAVDLRIESDDAGLPFHIVDIATGSKALELFRESVDNSLEYERNWYKSGLPAISEWLKTGTSRTEGTMKMPLKNLIESILRNSTLAIEAEQSRQLNAVLVDKVSASKLDSLRVGLAQWAERSHTELRDQLDIAFGGQRWRKLGWWKLFWRVDDVSMIAYDILSQRFLIEAEKEIIFFAGRLEESGLFKENSVPAKINWAYKPISEEWVGSGPPPPKIQDLVGLPNDDVPVKSPPKPWPLHIPAARTFLSVESVPALQALAQKLVLQTLTTSTFTSALAGLMYISTLSTTVYEAGAIAALGIVWSLKRMQKKWETARKFWEGEVREEGRKAVREVESAVGNALTQTTDRPVDSNGGEEFKLANEALRKAEVALKSCK